MKYDALSVYLNTAEDIVALGFDELEAILAFPLPASAYKYQAWWSNGGHTQADAWMNAGYLVSEINLAEKRVVFSKEAVSKEAKRPVQKDTAPNRSLWSVPSPRKNQRQPAAVNPQIPTAITLCDYPFRFIQEIRPVCDENGRLIEYSYQTNHPLNAYGAGPFCRFSIDADNVPGVYLWMVGDEIIYIGETIKLRQRFNNGYGSIQEVNCYAGGQTTNCKMNQVVRDLFLQGRFVKLYFYETADNKRVELELLTRINTKYNVKDNLPISDRDRFIVFDVETPNRYNNRMSAIGISVVEGGRITQNYFSYVNPDTFFDAFNTQLTGISERTVRNAPSFPELWRQIEPLMSSGILVAHNAPFDMGVLKKCLRDYGISWKIEADYCCTVQIGRRLLPGIQHKLNCLCDYYGICLDHHKADSDSRAAAEILLRYIESGVDIHRFVKRYTL